MSNEVTKKKIQLKTLKKLTTELFTKSSKIIHDAELSIEKKMLKLRPLKDVLHGKTGYVKNFYEQLNIEKDNQGIYRCQGRLQHAPLPYQARFPAVINQKHKLAELIVLEKHAIVKHAEVSQKLTEIRQEYWISKGRSFVRKMLRPCVTCRKFLGKPYPYPSPPPLTKLRLNDSRTFAVIAVDNCGPLFVRNMYGADRSMLKAWIVLFTCAASQGIVLDLVSDMSADSFIWSLELFLSRRGCPNDIISDNGRNFIARSTQNYATQYNIKWHFNLPLAPCFAPDRTIVNNRPITYVYLMELQQCLTPNHLLFARRLESIYLSPHDTSLAYIDVTAHHQQIYLTELRVQNRHKKTQEVKLDDIALIQDEKLPRSLWRIGRVLNILESKDNKIRGAEIILSNSTFLKRPVRSLYPVEYSPQKNVDKQSDNICNITQRRSRREAAIVGELKNKRFDVNINNKMEAKMSHKTCLQKKNYLNFHAKYKMVDKWLRMRVEAGDENKNNIFSLIRSQNNREKNVTIQYKQLATKLAKIHRSKPFGNVKL
ncbi:uncharacterized protein LOC130623107 [Hydractinia symbiolongicarpus]|uniref:uncharacterized protein LOC130623107 n=1 Tax=Hydractinia symbiolongicarpus TaxID=13093 RepID=UPI00255050F1|nr:uncharacterized protein LOC130623107 [Hydractinia symbiolongicarpus]